MSTLSAVGTIAHGTFARFDEIDGRDHAHLWFERARLTRIRFAQ